MSPDFECQFPPLIEWVITYCNPNKYSIYKYLEPKWPLFLKLGAPENKAEIPIKTRVKTGFQVGYNPLILTIDPNFPEHPPDAHLHLLGTASPQGCTPDPPRNHVGTHPPLELPVRSQPEIRQKKHRGFRS